MPDRDTCQAPIGREVTSTGWRWQPHVAAFNAAVGWDVCTGYGDLYACEADILSSEMPSAIEQ